MTFWCMLVVHNYTTCCGNTHLYSEERQGVNSDLLTATWDGKLYINLLTICYLICLVPLPGLNTNISCCDISPPML